MLLFESERGSRGALAVRAANRPVMRRLNTWAALPTIERWRWLERARATHMERGGTGDREADAVFDLLGARVTDLPGFFCALGEAINGPGLLRDEPALRRGLLRWRLWSDRPVHAPLARLVDRTLGAIARSPRRLGSTATRRSNLSGRRRAAVARRSRDARHEQRRSHTGDPGGWLGAWGVYPVSAQAP